ncbi:ABC transporter ATP-binding protein [Vulgatibacter incomptus]|uniref:Lipid A export ATP-binding/permease protein MsbA n=1 Tax=Vulgatibacter incomptus TaxID=1391653 RepID=A0A0K1PBX0_9BACT|nr:ABC transporter ATP-binding protein [Vulgatibacter incomptus]AKU90614.1 Lipid A export ATP-binding/permease protein MsbA [Vulgatibacter incomptus]
MSQGRASTTCRLLGVLRPQRLAIAAGFGCMIVLAVATAGYAWLIGPLLHFLTSGKVEGLGAMLPGLDPGSLDRSRVLLAVPLALLALGLAKGLAYFGHFYLMGMVAQRAVLDLRKSLFERIMRLAPQDLLGQRTGDLLSRFGDDLRAVENALHVALPTYLRDSLQVVVLLGLCFVLDWRLSLVAFGAVPLAVVPLTYVGRRLKRVARRGQQSVGALAGLAYDTIAGIRVVQAYGMQEHLAAKFDEENRRWLALKRKSLRSRGIASPAMELLSVMGVALVLAFAVYAMRDGALLSEKLLSFLSALALLLDPAKNLGKAGGFAIQGLGAAERIFEVLDLEPSVAESKQARALPRFSERIRFEGVSFRYGDRLVLDGVDLEVRRGEVVALVGPSGGGKSTLAGLLSRTADPCHGRITLDGIDLRDALLGSLREQIALVPQDVVLFDDTVRENVAYGVEASDEKIRVALRAARALDFVERLPQGLDTRVGERGATLSGGQRQRLAIARALLKDAPILVLDEATSALDSESEREVQAALDELMKGRTALVIAHRLSTIRDADRICVVDAGRIVEEGRHEELLERAGAYRRLHDVQQLRAGGAAA